MRRKTFRRTFLKRTKYAVCAVLKKSITHCLALAALIGLALTTPTLASNRPLVGVNVSGAEYSWLPFAGESDLDYLASKGVTLIRLPISWERMQPVFNGPLDQSYLNGLKTFLTGAGARRMQVIIDLHNYGRYNLRWAQDAAANSGIVAPDAPHSSLIGSPQVPISAFAGFWGKLAAALKGTPGLAYYDLMNEPYNMGSATVWRVAAQTAVNAIRAVDMHTSIFVEGTQWASAFWWPWDNGNLHIDDPANKVTYEAHLYFDGDGSGRYTQTYDQQGAHANVGADTVQPFLTWLTQKGARGFIGEFGVPNDDPRWITVLENFLQRIQAAGVSGTYWNYVYADPSGANSWWPVADPMSINPSRGWGSAQIEQIFAYSFPTISGLAAGAASNVIVLNGFAPPHALVRLYDGPTLLGSVPVAADGTWRFTTAQLPAGVHSFTAKSVNSAGTVSQPSDGMTVMISAAPATVGISISNNPSMIGTPVTLYANVTSARGTPTGNVRFKDGATVLGTQNLSGGTAAFTSSSLAIGRHLITAEYSGDSNFTAAASPEVVLAIKAAATMALSATPTVALQNQNVMLTATIYAAAQTVAPSGTVTFGGSAGTLGVGSVSAGTASFATSSLPVGTHTITATYSGDERFTTAESQVSLTVAGVKAATTTFVAATSNPAQAGQPITIAATVTSAVAPTGSSNMPSGNVVFKDGAKTLSAVTLSRGIATFSTSSLAVGTHIIIADYEGDDSFAPSTSPRVKLTVKASTKMLVRATTQPGLLDQRVAFTATIIATKPVTPPTGAVTFSKGSKVLGTAALVNGKVTFRTDALAAGRHTVTATYGGSATYEGSTSNVTVSVGWREFRVNTYRSGSQQLPAAIPLAGENFLIVWSSNNQDRSGQGIYGQSYTAKGDPAGSEFRVNTTTVNQQSQPSVAGIADGFVVVWASYNQDGSGYGVYGQRFNRKGVPTGTEFRINKTAMKHQREPSVAGLENGGFIVAWTSTERANGLSGIYGQRYDAAGNAAGGEFRLSSATARVHSRSSLTALAGGGFAVTWISEGVDGSRTGVFARRYNSSGKVASSELQVNERPVDTESALSIAGLNDDGFVIAWESNRRDNSGREIIGRYYSSTGKSTPEFRANTVVLRNQSQPSVASFPDGGFVVGWTSIGQDTSGLGVFARIYDAERQPVSSEFPVNETTAGDQSQPSIAAFTRGKFLVTWASDDQDGSLEGVYARRFESSEVASTVAHNENSKPEIRVNPPIGPKLAEHH